MPVETEWKEIQDKIKDFNAKVKEIKLENPVEPQTEILSRTDKELTGLVTLEEVKHAYWNRCIAGVDSVTGEPYKRFVAQSPYMAESNGNTHRAIDIWEPKSVDEDFNLVLSLCTDGLHRCLVDHDSVALAKPQIESSHPGRKGLVLATVVPSTSNWHIYNHYGRSFDYQVGVAGNPAYVANVKRAGFASLRPPWISKGWMEPVFYKSEFHGFLDEDWLPPVPEDDGKLGWEDLFNEG